VDIELVRVEPDGLLVYRISGGMYSATALRTCLDEQLGTKVIERGPR
jgi:hypothetical protein